MIRVELPHGLGPLTVSLAELLGQVTTCDNGVLGIAMPKVILDQPQVVAAVGQREAAGMSKHVRMDGRPSRHERPPRRADSSPIDA
jgi:hypothetical protein